MYGLLGNAVRVTLGSSVGAHIDRAERWEGARDCYVIQVIGSDGKGPETAT